MTTGGEALNKRIELLNRLNISRGKAYSDNIDLYTSSILVKIVNHWVEKGILNKEKVGRRMIVSLTDKGKKYLEAFNKIKPMSDFLDG